MKKILSITALLLFVFALSAQNTIGTTNSTNTTKVAPVEEKPKDPDGPVIEFNSKTIDYGVIAHKADGNREFKFTNTGKKPLIITNCKGSCGCTVPKCPREEIKPGESGVIKVKYATDRVGKFTKMVTVTSNATNDVERLTIKGEVLPGAPATTTPTKDAGNPGVK